MSDINFACIFVKLDMMIYFPKLQCLGYAAINISFFMIKQAMFVLHGTSMLCVPVQYYTVSCNFNLLGAFLGGFHYEKMSVIVVKCTIRMYR